MYRGSYSNRGARRGGRGGNRGGFRNASHGNHNRNPTSVANRPNTSTVHGPQRSRAALTGGCFLPKHIFSHFNPSTIGYDRSLMSTINNGQEKPNGVCFVTVHVQNQPQWMDENIIYVKSNLHLLPDYAEKKSLLLENHKETDQEELMERIASELTQSIKFDRYGVEDGPDVELFDAEGQIVSLVLPGDWMPVNHEPPKFASVDTPSVKYAPVSVDPVAVFAGYRNDSYSSGFKFVAWFLIEEIELFAANSLDLARKMHDKKWTGDIGHEWAAVKLIRVEKGEPEWRPVPDIKRRPAMPQASYEVKNVAETLQISTELVREVLASVATMGAQNEDSGPVHDGDEVHRVETGQPLDEVQERKSKPQEDGSGDATNEAVADFGANTDNCGDVIQNAENEAGVENEVKTEVAKVENHMEDTKGGSVEEKEAIPETANCVAKATDHHGGTDNKTTPETDNSTAKGTDHHGGTDNKTILETDNSTAKGTGHHGEGVLSFQPKDKEAAMEKGEKLVEGANVEADSNVAPTGIPEETVENELMVEKTKEDQITVKVLTTADEDGEAKEEKEDQVRG